MKEKLSVTTIVLLLALVGFTAVLKSQRTPSQSVPSWGTKSYLKLVNGNALYSWCQGYESHAAIRNAEIRFGNASRRDMYHAGKCWAYVLAVVDSIPEGEGVNPSPDVRANQYIDAVFSYLEKHPEARQGGAYFLARTALTEAFPEHWNKARKE